MWKEQYERLMKELNVALVNSESASQCYSNQNTPSTSALRNANVRITGTRNQSDRDRSR